MITIDDLDRLMTEKLDKFEAKIARIFDYRANHQRSAAPINQTELRAQFTYHPPNSDQPDRYVLVREAGFQLVATIMDNTVASTDQTAAIRKVREAVMTANAAIALE